ncbi:hypothetical protein BDY19DRAFT_910935 [Irpex rosettiformis]|uniref:Uncharacterized protein n=1 Tax=Irpex rosettiformis TaxID=378272 RepID=A0ACB8TLW6_9APHY|nr:hypothetical protein BDY19DRAFT_910935 [Irpex rosettiformis]
MPMNNKQKHTHERSQDAAPVQPAIHKLGCTAQKPSKRQNQWKKKTEQIAKGYQHKRKKYYLETRRNTPFSRELWHTYRAIVMVRNFVWPRAMYTAKQGHRPLVDRTAQRKAEPSNQECWFYECDLGTGRLHRFQRTAPPAHVHHIKNTTAFFISDTLGVQSKFYAHSELERIEGSEGKQRLQSRWRIRLSQPSESGFLPSHVHVFK